MKHWLADSWDLLATLAPMIGVGVLVMIACVGVGWHWSVRRSSAAVRAVSWWLRRVVLPLVNRGGWFRRARVIFVNNVCVCAAVVAAGMNGAVSWAAIGCVGFALGVGLRVLAESRIAQLESTEPEQGVSGRKVRIGVLLNLLELPAIALTVGLSLGQDAFVVTIPAGRAWRVFGVFVVGLLLLGAVGEAMWMEALLPGGGCAERGGETKEGK